MLEPYDLSSKLAYAGARSPIPFTTGPEYTNSVPAVPVLAMLRVFIASELWNLENVQTAGREICRVLGAGSQFDIGMTVAGGTVYSPDRPVQADTARLMKLDPRDPRVQLRFRSTTGETLYVATFPRLRFEPTQEDFWQAVYAPGAVKEPTQP